MSTKTDKQLTPRERLTRGLSHTATGPVDVTRGVVGLGTHSAHSTASELRRRYREGRLAREIDAAQETIAQELAAAHDAVANLPQTLRDAQQSRRRLGKRPLLITGAAILALAGGGAAFRRARRSLHRERFVYEEPSPRPPSVGVEPHRL